MRTIDELIAWLAEHKAANPGKRILFRYEALIDFIDSEAPCKHFQVYGQAGAHFTKAGERANYCPGCGKELKGEKS